MSLSNFNPTTLFGVMSLMVSTGDTKEKSSAEMSDSFLSSKRPVLRIICRKKLENPQKGYVLRIIRVTLPPL